MTIGRRRLVVAFIGIAVIVLVALAVIAEQLPSAGANGLLRPARRRAVGLDLRRVRTRRLPAKE
jgi:hypothetical protein